MDQTSTPTAAIERWQPLAWDTSFFGVSIGRADLRGADAASIATTEEAARAAGVDCLYAEVDATDHDLALQAQRAGYRVVDVALDLAHQTTAMDLPSTAHVRDGSTADLDDLSELFAVVAPWSRFAADPRFGLPAAIALQRAAAERAISGIDGRRLLVAEDATGAVVGYLTLVIAGHDDPLGSPGSQRRIDLIATNRPDAGIAIALVSRAFACFGAGPSVCGTIAARNIAALRCSEHFGYRISAATYQLHRWLDEPAASSTEAAAT